MIKLVNFNYTLSSDDVSINTTSRSTNWSSELSPFFLGPVHLYGNYISKNVENAWQYSKLYQYFSDNGLVSDRYFSWATKGWNSVKADRYPMGRDCKPICSYWDGKYLTYIEARKEIYIPLYKSAVKNTKAFHRLKDIYEKCLSENKILHLLDFDLVKQFIIINYSFFVSGTKTPDLRLYNPSGFQ